MKFAKFQNRLTCGDEFFVGVQGSEREIAKILHERQCGEQKALGETKPYSPRYSCTGTYGAVWRF